MRFYSLIPQLSNCLEVLCILLNYIYSLSHGGSPQVWGLVQEWNERSVLLSRPCRWPRVLGYAAQQWTLRTNYPTLLWTHQVQPLFCRGNLAEGAEVLLSGAFNGFGGLSLLDIEFDQCTDYFNTTTWGDFVSACQVCGLIKQVIKLSGGHFRFL